jgi:PAS domain S-box-containing protein
MFELFPVGTYRSSADGRMLRANPALLALNGFDSEAELIKHFNDLARQWYVDPTRRDAFLAGIERDGHVLDFVSEIYRYKSRERIWVKENAHAVRDAQGKILFYEGTVEDITESRATRLALQESEALLRHVTSQVPGMVYRMHFAPGSPGQYTFVSDGIRQLFGVEPELALRDAAVLRQLRHPDDTAWVGARIAQAIAQRLPLALEFRIRLPDGRTKWVEMASSAAPDVGDSLVRTGVLIDITSRKLAELELLRRERFLETLTNSLPSMLAYWDADCVCQFSNRSYQEWFGKTEQEMHGLQIADLLGPDLHRVNEPHIQAALRGEGQRFERTIRQRNGATGYVIAEYIPDISEGRVQGFVTLVSNITEIKLRQLEFERLNAELKQTTELAREASVAKSRFLANMSHEIRTPMNAILGMLSLAENTGLSAQQTDYIGKAKSAANALLRLLNDILDLSKVEANKMSLDLQPASLEDLLRDISAILSNNIGAKNVEVLLDVDPRLPAVLWLDAQRLHQVLINLASNAIKFTPQGEVLIGLRLVQLQAGQAEVEFSVQDNGIGIPPDMQAKLFTDFTQAESSTTREYGGTGLGLAISQRLVQLMGGHIGLHSTPGVGSRFFFNLPLALPEPAPAPRPAAAEQPARRALVVDDNRTSAQTMAQAIASWGWTVQVAHSGAEALQHMRVQHSGARFAFDVVYLDWHMPQMDGWQLAQAIRHIATQCSGAAPLLVMVTSQSREQLSHRTPHEQSLLNAFLVKPVTPGMLWDAAQVGGANPFHVRRSERRSGGQRRLLGIRILVVEDNLINQQVAEELLIAEGALVSLAANGRIGVDAVAAAAPQFDVVLMDIQMPVLDGYGATREIRHDLQLHDLPIIAMTANAMASDRDACLAAGMNEHVGKPFDMGRLVSLLLRVTGLADGSHRDALAGDWVAHDAPDLPEVPGLDLAAALARMSGMRSLYVRTARDFTKILASVVEEVQQALAGGDTRQAQMRLHTLKGNAATLGALPLSAQAAELERLVKTGASAAACAVALDALGQLTRATQDQLQQAMDRLGTATEPASPGAVKPVSDAELLALLRELDALLAQSDLLALDRFAQMRQPLGQLPDGFFDALELAMQDLDFARAHTLCAERMAQLVPHTAAPAAGARAP